jgi:hypothetical protein
MFYFFIVVAYLGVLLFLQIGLSRRENPAYGLIIPIFYFLLICLATGAVTGGDHAFWRHLQWFLIANIPTGIYLLIYFYTRLLMARKAERELMDLRDWE